MSFRKASECVSKNKSKWSANVPTSSFTNRRALPRIVSLINCVRLPSNIQVLSRYHVLFEEEKQKRSDFRSYMMK